MYEYMELQIWVLHESAEPSLCTINFKIYNLTEYIKKQTLQCITIAPLSYQVKANAIVSTQCTISMKLDANGRNHLAVSIGLLSPYLRCLEDYLPRCWAVGLSQHT